MSKTFTCYGLVDYEYAKQIDPFCVITDGYHETVYVSTVTKGYNVAGKSHPATIEFFDDDAALLFQLKYSDNQQILLTSWTE
jgi:hypothetical protein